MPTATATKTENYTSAMVTKMVADYTACGTGIAKADHEARAEVVKQLASEFKKEIRSIRSKLVNEKVYIKVSKESTVTKGEPEKKEVMAQRVADAFGVEMIDGKECRLNPASLEKMNKIELGILLNRFNSEVIEQAEMDTAETENENESQEGDSES